MPRPLVALVAVSLGLFLWGASTMEGISARTCAALWGGAFAGIGGWLVLCRGRVGARLAAREKETVRALDALPAGRLGLWILLASAAGLFLELFLIRWHASAFQLFAYYRNVSLLAGFLGLGIGYARAGAATLALGAVLPAVSFQVAATHVLRFTSLQEELRNPVSEQLVMGGAPIEAFSHAALSYGFLLLMFVATALTCVPLGQLAGRLMARQPVLSAYGWNLLGSLAGVAAFSLLALAWTGPAAWLGILACSLLPFLCLGESAQWRAGPGIAATALAVSVLTLPIRPHRVDLYSPYQVLSLEPAREGTPTLLVNNLYFQRILDLRPGAPRGPYGTEAAGVYYDFPYVLKPAPDRVLVMGSGTGNDVAAALRAGARRVDAVEIDPAILALGRRLHPESPYDDPRVAVHVGDARDFVRRDRARYDLVVYGLLDSHTLLSGRASLRLDSFVYTVEAFREAASRLAPDGVLAMTFSVLSEAQGKKFYRMLEEAFGEEPRVFHTRYDAGYMFVSGSGSRTVPAPEEGIVREVTDHFRRSPAQVDVSTDDWPFPYMPERRYPATYLMMAGAVLGASFLLLRGCVPARGGRFPLDCFFLGAGFMLVETRALTELSLHFGSTWWVTTLVVVSILLLGWLANLVVRRRGISSPRLVYGALLASLALGWAWGGTGLSVLPSPAEKAGVTALATLPLFFAGMAFSAAAARAADLPQALFANLLGAVVGGLLENNAMYLGFAALYPMAAGLYAAAFFCALLGQRAGTSRP